MPLLCNHSTEARAGQTLYAGHTWLHITCCWKPENFAAPMLSWRRIGALMNAKQDCQLLSGWTGVLPALCIRPYCGTLQICSVLGWANLYVLGPLHHMVVGHLLTHHNLSILNQSTDTFHCIGRLSVPVPCTHRILKLLSRLQPEPHRQNLGR